MKPNIKFKVNEMFRSIEGEGIRSGQLCSFIRFSGCNLNCIYCDTVYAQNKDLGDWVYAEDIENWLIVGKFKNVTLTGGEPLIQQDIEVLIKKILDLGFNVNIETNGSISLHNIKKLFAYKNLIITMDYKLPSSRMENSTKVHNLELLRENDVLKFVVEDLNDMDYVKMFLKYYDIKANVFISPVFGKADMVAFVDYMSKEDCFNKVGARLQVQLHKIIWGPEKRGV